MLLRWWRLHQIQTQMSIFVLTMRRLVILSQSSSLPSCTTVTLQTIINQCGSLSTNSTWIQCQFVDLHEKLSSCYDNSVTSSYSICTYSICTYVPTHPALPLTSTCNSMPLRHIISAALSAPYVPTHQHYATCRLTIPPTLHAALPIVWLRCVSAHICHWHCFQSTLSGGFVYIFWVNFFFFSTSWHWFVIAEPSVLIMILRFYVGRFIGNCY